MLPVTAWTICICACFFSLFNSFHCHSVANKEDYKLAFYILAYLLTYRSSGCSMAVDRHHYWSDSSCHLHRHLWGQTPQEGCWRWDEMQIAPSRQQYFTAAVSVTFISLKNTDLSIGFFCILLPKLFHGSTCTNYLYYWNRLVPPENRNRLTVYVYTTDRLRPWNKFVKPISGVHLFI